MDTIPIQPKTIQQMATKVAYEAMGMNLSTKKAKVSVYFYNEKGGFISSATVELGTDQFSDVPKGELSSAGIDKMLELAGASR